ncbi:MAG: MFS transporter, partial [Patescibacteria group bacterium]|nr:MFS transporter [Patescibacteria group bacterium]
PIFAKDILVVGPQGVGLLYSAPAIGSLAAGFFLSLLPVPKKQGILLLCGVCIYGIATVFFGISHAFLLSLVMLALVGAGDMVSAVIRNTIRQLETPDSLRGRMIAINMNFFVGGPYLGDVEAGVTASWWGAPISVVVGGVATILFTLGVAYAVPKLRKYTAEQLSV